MDDKQSFKDKMALVHDSVKLEAGHATTFSLTINLPGTTIDLLRPVKIETAFVSHQIKSGILTQYILFREDGKRPPETSHYHLWCNSSAPVRLDNLVRDYFKPIIRTLGFSDDRCKGRRNGRRVYIAVQCSKIRDTKNEWDDFAYSLGYVCKEGNMISNTFTYKGVDMFNYKIRHVIKMLCTKNDFLEKAFPTDDQNVRTPSWSSLMTNLIAAAVQYRKNSLAEYTIRTKNVSDLKTRDFLDSKYPMAVNYGDACLRAVNEGYQMHCLKTSVRLRGGRLTPRQKIYIFHLFGDPLPKDLQDYVDLKELQGIKFPRKRKFYSYK